MSSRTVALGLRQRPKVAYQFSENESNLSSNTSEEDYSDHEQPQEPEEDIVSVESDSTVGDYRRFSSRSKPKTSYQEELLSESDEAPIEPEVEDHSDKIDKILDFKNTSPPEFLIKYAQKSHLHLEWLTEEQAKHIPGFKKLSNYIKHTVEPLNYLEDDALEELLLQQEFTRDMIQVYQTVERILSLQDEQALVKWSQLDYSECTWEFISNLPQDKLDQYLLQQNSTTTSKHSKKSRTKLQFDQQPDYIPFPLRDYQCIGVNWMLHQWSNQKNGILADEMGLGKTIQCISFLHVLFQHGYYGPSLIISPLSVLDNWHLEFQKWAPQMDVIVYAGNTLSRSLINDYELPRHPNCILTTYEMILKDKAILGKIPFQHILIDEGHRLKNANSQLHETLLQFKTKHKLIITGTPLQNNLQELQALLDFLHPNQHHVDLVDPSSEALQDIHKTLKQFCLRRTKQDVEQLPSKVELNLRVPMTAHQIQVYKDITNRNYAQLAKVNSKISLLNVMMELKKCVNHPYLLQDSYDIDSEEALKRMVGTCGKLKLLDQLLVKLKGEKMLIFSQMVHMLDILADYLKMKQIRFQRLDGRISSVDRKKAVQQFHNNPNDHVFLLSTKAGGLGLTLTAANHVIIYDSDFNPQNDLQAMARSHRIGQTKQVTVYRLIAKDTIDEEIIERAKQKRILEFALINHLDRKSKAFNREDLNHILKLGANNMFNAALEEVNLDHILNTAEQQEDVGVGMNNDFLDQFKVQDCQLNWDDIVPQEVVQEVKTKELVQQLGHRKRRKVNYTTNLGDKEIKRLVKALMVYSQERVEDIVEMSGVQNDKVQQVIVDVMEGVYSHLIKYPDALYRRQELLKRIQESCEGNEMGQYRIVAQLRKSKMAKWTVVHDAKLVYGTYKYGYGQYAMMAEDKELGLNVNMYKEEQLNRRLEYVSNHLKSTQTQLAVKKGQGLRPIRKDLMVFRRKIKEVKEKKAKIDLTKSYLMTFGEYIASSEEGGLWDALSEEWPQKNVNGKRLSQMYNKLKSK